MIFFHQSHIYIYISTHNACTQNVNIKGKMSFKFETSFFFLSEKGEWAQHISQYFYKIFVMSGSESMFNFFFLLFCFI